MNLSLPPRADQFRFNIPKEYIPTEVLNKYDSIISSNPSTFNNSIDYLNESIQGITLPSIDGLIVEQPQVSHNGTSTIPRKGGRMNTEPDHINVYLSAENILTKVANTFTVTFRRNQGLYNYFMLYESIFHRYIKPELYRSDKTEVFEILFLDEHGIPASSMKLLQPEFNSISALEFSYDKVERQADTFTVDFVFNNIDFDFLPNN